MKDQSRRIMETLSDDLVNALLQELDGIDVDLPSVWDRVIALRGRRLTTASGRATFEIESIFEDRILMRIHSSGAATGIERQQVERAAELGLVRVEILPRELRRAGIGSSATYLAGILRALAADESSPDGQPASPTASPRRRRQRDGDAEEAVLVELENTLPRVMRAVEAGEMNPDRANALCNLAGRIQSLLSSH